MTDNELRKALKDALKTIADLTQEIERLREQAERDRRAINATYTVQRDLNAEIERLRTALQMVVDCHDVRSELYTSDEMCAAAQRDYAAKALRGGE